MKLQGSDLGAALQSALNSSLSWLNIEKPSNSLRSSRFCSDFGERMEPLIQSATPNDIMLTRRQISVSDSGPRQSGEWLLDIVWTQDHRPDPRMHIEAPSIPVKVWCAVECESQTSARELFIDLAKLIQIRSSVKVFLAGLNQKTERAALAYIDLRLQQIYDFINISEITSDAPEWYVGFWPSPEKSGDSSMWDQLSLYPHLNRTYLYKMNDSGFVRIEPTDSAKQGFCSGRKNPLS